MAWLRRIPRWGLYSLAVAIVLATGLAVWLVAARTGQEIEEFKERGLAYAEAFSESATAWIERGDLEMLKTAARFMLLGSAAFVQVEWDGELLVDERVGEVPEPGGEEAELVALPSGERYLLITLPIPTQEAPRGRVSLGLDASWLYADRKNRILVGTGVGLAVDLVLLGALFSLARRGRAQQQKGGPSFKVGGLEVFEEGKQVYLFGQPVRLSPKQFALLRLLASSPGRVFSDREILKEVWPDSRYANSKDVKQYVYLVRQRLGRVRPGAEGMIVTVPGFGYKLIPPDEAGLTDR